MRRKDKEISDLSAIEAIINKATVCRLAMANGDKPYLVPMSFGYQDHSLYFHGALKGQKIDMLKKNPTVCFEIDVSVEAVSNDDACAWSMQFQSVIGFGKAAFVEGLEAKRQSLYSHDAKTL